MREPIEKAKVWFEEYQMAETQEEKESILKKFKTYLTLYPNDSETRYVYILLLASGNRLKEALQQVEECLLHRPIPRCIILKAALLNSIGHSEEACKYIRQAKQYLKGNDRMEMEIIELLALIDSNRYEEALSLLRKIGKEKLLKFADKNSQRAENVLDILSELESYEKGKEWAQEHKEFLNTVQSIYSKYFKVRGIIPKLEGDWEIPSDPVVYVDILDTAADEEEAENIFDRESQALREVFSKFSNETATITLAFEMQEKEAYV